MDISSKTGLEILQALIAGKIPPPSISTLIPMKPVHAEDGMVRFEVEANNQMLNPMGGVHGGFAATVLDTVTGCAVHSKLEAGESYATVDLGVKMLRPVPTGQTLIATGSILQMTRSLGVSEGRLEDQDGLLYAHATCTCKILRRRT